MAVFRGALTEDASAQFRHQRQKLRGLPTELLAEFRGQPRAPSMIAHSKTVFISIYRFFNVILTSYIHVRTTYGPPCIYNAPHSRAMCISVVYYRGFGVEENRGFGEEVV